MYMLLLLILHVLLLFKMSQVAQNEHAVNCEPCQITPDCYRLPTGL